MQRGEELVGQVINDETGELVADIYVYARPKLREGETEFEMFQATLYDSAGVRTDAEGRFRIRSLVARDHTLGILCGKPVHADRFYSPSHEKTIELRVKLVDDFETKRAESIDRLFY